jgi:BirA family biotin operon repressor/biotin-[acetyl-CoA-carboxylase] ligase
MQSFCSRAILIQKKNKLVIMQQLDEKAGIQAWQNCFLPVNVWEPCKLDSIVNPLWTRELNGTRAFLAASCASTMDLAWKLADEGRFPQMSWAAAVIQTCGRGQCGRAWDSPAGNMYATIRLPDDIKKARLMLPLMVALVIADELNARSIHAQIKWPNDILLGQKKVGGILIEERQGKVMAGIGLNIAGLQETGQCGASYRLPAASLSQFGCLDDAPKIWQNLTGQFTDHLPGLMAKPQAIKDRVEQVLAFKDDDVILEQGNGESSLVRILGISTSGGLIILSPKGEETVWSGRIIPRCLI